MSVRAGREFLAIPGPTKVPDEVLRAMHRPVVGQGPNDHSRDGGANQALGLLHGKGGAQAAIEWLSDEVKAKREVSARLGRDVAAT